MGLRVGKVDSTGTYIYVCDGTSPGSPVLIDGHTLYTPGLSESLGGSSRYYDFDRMGNLWTVDGTSKNQLAYEDFSGFGGVTAIGGSNASAFKFGGENGCQTDADTGLVLMGHRYYDNRQGRFISQDPIGDGDNWYAYAGNNPINKTDPSGLSIVDLPTAEAQGHNEMSGFMEAISGGGEAASEAWGAVDDSIERGHQEYLQSEIAKSLQELLFDETAAQYFFSYHGFTPSEVKKIKHLINIINTTPVGHELIAEATLSKKNYEIIKNTGMQRGDPQTGKTFFNFDFQAYPIVTLGGNIHASALRTLAHEFGHSIGGYYDSYDPANGNPDNLMMNVDHSENPIMTVLAGPGATRLIY